MKPEKISIWLSAAASCPNSALYIAGADLQYVINQIRLVEDALDIAERERDVWKTQAKELENMLVKVLSH